MDLSNMLYGGIPELSSAFPSGASLTSMPNIFGGSNIMGPSGQMLASTSPNIFGGTNIMDSGGMSFAHTQPNVFGGSDIYGMSGSNAYTQPNIFGGENLFSTGLRNICNRCGSPRVIGIPCQCANIFGTESGFIGHTQPNIFGGVDFQYDGTQMMSSQPNIFGGMDSSFFNPPPIESLAMGLTGAEGAVIPDPFSDLPNVDPGVLDIDLAALEIGDSWSIFDIFG